MILTEIRGDKWLSKKEELLDEVEEAELDQDELIDIDAEAAS